MTSNATATSMQAAPWDNATAVGVLTVAASALALSTAGFFARLIEVDVWTMLFWRGVFGGLLILAYIAAQARGRTRAAFAAIGRAGLLIAGCSAAATICFIAALRASTVADVTILFTTAPFFAAAIAWICFREAPHRMTLAASVLALAGVAIMFGTVPSGRHAFGNALAVTMTLLMAVVMVTIRRHRHVSMLPAMCLSAFVCAAAVWPLARPAGVTGTEFALLALFGTTQFGLGMLLLTIGSRYISATRASLLCNLELPFAPLWVWLAFGEAPAAAAWAGGAVVCAAILLDLAAARRPGG